MLFVFSLVEIEFCQSCNSVAIVLPLSIISSHTRILRPFSKSLNFNSYDSSPRGIAFSNNGMNAYIVGSNAEKI